MKKIVAFLIATVMTLSFCACNNTADISLVSDTTSETTTTSTYSSDVTTSNIVSSTDVATSTPTSQASSEAVSSKSVVSSRPYTYVKDIVLDSTTTEMPVVVDAYAVRRNHFDFLNQLSYAEKLRISTFMVPKINIDTAVTRQINNEIMDDFNELQKKFPNGKTLELNFNTYYSYAYTYVNGILVLAIYDCNGYFYSEYYTEVTLYYYDVKNDKRLNEDEYFSMFGLNKDELATTFNTVFNGEAKFLTAVYVDKDMLQVFYNGHGGVSDEYYNSKGELYYTLRQTSWDIRRASIKYVQAREAYRWFKAGEMPVTSQAKEKDGQLYLKINIFDMKTKADIEQYLLSLFSKEIVNKLLADNSVLDFNGEAYFKISEKVSDIYEGNEAFSIRCADDGDLVIVTTEKLSGGGDERKVVSYNDNTFALKIEDGNSVFTNFDFVK